ncbi:MAG TPA: hypothetical protein VGQ92_15605 [Actinoplanes sp.]|nr:hypothetical protein [Actinoplanes sp.]
MIVSDAEAPPTPEQGAERRGLDRTIRIAGVVISVLAAIVTGALEIFSTQLRIGGVLVGVSILAALVANPAIAWFAVTTTGRRWALGPPWIVWTIVMLGAAGIRTDEGDYLISGSDWVALVMILVGSLAFAVYSYRMILSSRPPL